MFENQSSVKIAQLALTFTIATSILYIYSWPFAFLFPLLTLHIRFYELTSIPFQNYVTLFFVSLSGIAFGFAISFLYPISPSLFITVLGGAIFAVNLWDKHNPNQTHKNLRVLSIVLISAIAMANNSIVTRFTAGLVVSLLLAMVLCYILDKVVSSYLYKQESIVTTVEQHVSPVKGSSTQWQALFIFLPAVFIFIWLELLPYYVAVVAICVLTLEPYVKIIKNNSKQYLAANLLGSSIALGGYTIYAVVEPHVGTTWLLGLSVTILTSVVLGVIIYRTHFQSLAQFVLSPFALLFIQSDRIDFGILDNYQVRILSVFVAVVYVYIAALFMSFCKDNIMLAK